MDAVEVAAGTLGTVLGCPVALTGDTAGFLRDFEERYAFLPAAQPALTASYLGGFVDGMAEHVVHELTEPLGTAVTVLHLPGRLAVIGPYTARALRANEATALLGQVRIPGAHLQAFSLYRSSFAIVDSEFVMRGAVALLEAAGCDGDRVGFERVATSARPLDEGVREPAQSAPFAAIETRYAIEHDFIEAVSEGNERRALDALRRMSTVPRPPGYLNTPFLGATILRIMTRVAAQLGGLPPVTIDAISQTYAQELHRSGHSPDAQRTAASIAAMVGEFCRNIRRHQQSPYSPAVRRAMDHVALHLSHHVTPGELAERAGVSESHLGRLFKAETGWTLTQYVARERARRAAQLLASTDQPVRDIAAHVGYLDANYFVKVFRTAYAMTPSEYRRSQA